MKTKYIAILPVLAFLLTGCIYDGLPNENMQERNVTITALLAEETQTSPKQTEPNTRISMEENGLDIDLYWENGDKIQLGIVYTNTEDKTIKTVQEVQVVVDTENNRKATFDVVIPSDVKDKFDLYGLYGGKGLSTDDPSKAILPETEDFFAHDLHTLYEKKVVMLYFEARDIDKTTPAFGVNFQHMGSFFKILVKNTGTATINNITEATLEQDGTIGLIPAYAQSNRFNIADKYFLKDATVSDKVTQVSFSANHIYQVENGVLAFWAWLPVAKGEGEGADWPALRLSIKNGIEGSTTTIHTDYKSAKKATTGKAYHFYATHDGSTLTFVEESAFTVPDGTVDASGTGILADTRDGNLYATVRIGTQTWMQENLKYLPVITQQSTDVSNTESKYYVYGTTGVGLSSAKNSANYKKYGVLYNWTAAMNGAASSATIPSCVQGACPPGWHVPSRGEWDAMGTYLTSNRYTYDGSAVGPWSRIAKALATGRPDWADSTEEGAPGNTDASDKINVSKFSALPGGYMASKNFYYLTTQAFFWSTEEHSTNTKAFKRRIEYNKPGVTTDENAKTSAMSVRCIKD